MPTEPARAPRFVSFTLAALALSAVLGLLLDWSLVDEPSRLFARLLGAAFLPLLAALPVAALAFHGARRGLMRRAIAPVAVFAAVWAARFALGLASFPAGGHSTVFILAGGLAVFAATAGLMALALLTARAVVAGYDRRLASVEAGRPRPILAYPAFALTFTAAALAVTQLWFGAALGREPGAHLLHLLQLTLPPLAIGLLAGVSGFHDPAGGKPLGRRIAPSCLAFASVWVVRAVFLGGHGAAAGLAGAQVGLIGAGLFVLVAAFALYAVQGIMRIAAERRSAV